MQVTASQVIGTCAASRCLTSVQEQNVAGLKARVGQVLLQPLALRQRERIVAQTSAITVPVGSQQGWTGRSTTR